VRLWTTGRQWLVVMNPTITVQSQRVTVTQYDSTTDCGANAPPAGVNTPAPDISKCWYLRGCSG